MLAILKATGTTSNELIPGDTFSSARFGGLTSLSITVIPILTPELLKWDRTPAAFVLIMDPDDAPQPRALIIQRTLGLTNAEAALANLLFDGISLREAAQSLERSINTCKSQLKSIYSKTGCRSHVDLAKLLLMSTLTQRG